MENEPTVLYEVRDGIAYITFNRPERYNATRHLEYELLHDYVKKSHEDDDVRAVILSGKGKHFTVSDDLAGLQTDASPWSNRVYGHWHDQSWADWVARGEEKSPAQAAGKIMLESGKVYIAAVQGLCYVTEFTFAMDFVIAADNAMFSFPDLLVGQSPCGCGTVVLPRIVGRRRALEMFLDPAPFTAEDAYRRGIVSKVVPLPDLMAEAEALARRTIIYNPQVIALFKKQITRTQGPVDEFLRVEQMYAGFCHKLPGGGIPTGDWINLLGYPTELLEGMDFDKSYNSQWADKDKK